MGVSWTPIFPFSFTSTSAVSGLPSRMKPSCTVLPLFSARARVKRVNDCASAPLTDVMRSPLLSPAWAAPSPLMAWLTTTGTANAITCPRVFSISLFTWRTKLLGRLIATVSVPLRNTVTCFAPMMSSILVSWVIAAPSAVRGMSPSTKPAFCAVSQYSIPRVASVKLMYASPCV